MRNGAGTLTTLTPTLRGKGPQYSEAAKGEPNTHPPTSPTKALPKAKDNRNLPLRAKKEQRLLPYGAGMQDLLKPENVNLLVKSIGTDAIKRKSSWIIWVGPKSNEKYP